MDRAVLNEANLKNANLERAVFTRCSSTYSLLSFAAIDGSTTRGFARHIGKHRCGCLSLTLF